MRSLGNEDEVEEDIYTRLGLFVFLYLSYILIFLSQNYLYNSSYTKVISFEHILFYLFFLRLSVCASALRVLEQKLG